MTTLTWDPVSRSTLEERRVVLNVLRRNKAECGVVPSGLARAASERLGVSTRQVRRWLAQDDLTVRSAFVPTEKHIDILYSTHGNVAKAWRLCVEHGYLPDPAVDSKNGIGERQFRRGFDVHVDAAIVKGAKKGWSGFVARRGYGKKFAPCKGDTYATDSTPMDMWVRGEDGNVHALWETNLIDEHTRLALVVATSNSQPDTNTVIAVMAAGIGGYKGPDGRLIGGMPEHVLSDNGGEYKSMAVTAGLVRVGFKMVVDGTAVEDDGHVIKRKFTHRASGFANGISERFHQTMHRDFAASLPGYVDPDLPEFERLNRIQYWKDHPDQLLTKDQVDALLARWVEKYNFEHVHSGLTGELKGMTPYQAWCHDEKDLPVPDPETMRLSMLAGEYRIVDKGRVRIFSTHYYLPELGSHNGHEVEVRYLPGRTEHVDVFYLGQHLGEAIREDLLGDNFHAQVTNKRDKQTEVHLAHALGAAKFKTEVATKELLALGFAEDDLPATPEDTWAHTQVVRRRDKKAGPAVSREDREFLDQAVAAEAARPTGTIHNPYDDEEFIA